MTHKRNLIDRVLGLEEKKIWAEFEKRAKNLPQDYYQDYKKMQDYLWISGITSWEDFKFAFDHLLDLLEDLSAENRKVTEFTGEDVAAFLDEMLDTKSWEKKQAEKLNKKVSSRI
ncbi:MAG: DUF1048 domain-containing protein [Lactovum sp.]